MPAAGSKKVIFGDGGINKPIIDINGEVAMTEHAMAIEVKSMNEANKVKKGLMSKEFNNILKACSWSLFRIDWNMFSSFKRDFYNYL